MKRQQTQWIFLYSGTKGTYLRVGWIHNKNKGKPDDRIRVRIKSLTCNLDFNARIDEALALVTGIGKTMAKQAIFGRIKIKEVSHAKGPRKRKDA